MADEMDADTSLRLKRRTAEIEDKQEPTIEHNSLSLSTESELSHILSSATKEDQELAEITSSFVSDSVNSPAKKVRCSQPQPDPVEKKTEVYGHVKDDEIAGIAECSLGFSGVKEKKEDMQERENLTSYYASCSRVDENRGSSKNEEVKQFLVESEAGSIIEVTDFGSKDETLGESTKIEEIKEVNKIVVKDGEKVDELKGIDDSSIRCSLKIEVIDETALIETVHVSKTGNGCGKEMRNCGKKNGQQNEMDGKKEKRQRRRGKGLKKGLEMNEKKGKVLTHHIGESRNGCFGKNEGEGKRVYSRNEMEALRFVNIEKQKGMWYEVYCGLGPAVAREYNDLVNSANQKHIRLNFDPRQQYGKKGEAPAILGVVAARGRGNHLKIYVH